MGKSYTLLCLTLLGFFILTFQKARGQQLIEKRISISINNEPLDKVLQKIAELGGFSFSYSPDAIDISKRVSIQASNESIREILTEIFKGKVIFKERRRYIILQKNSVQEEEAKPENFQLNGYIINKKTGERLPNASIFESVTLASAISNEYGYYKIRLPAAPSSIRLEVRKEDFIGISFPVTNRKDTYLPIALLPDTLRPIPGTSPKIIRRTDSLHHKVAVPQYQAPFYTVTENDTTYLSQYNRIRQTYKKVQNEFINAFASAKQTIHTRNIDDTLYRTFQASLLPLIGTNHQLSGNVINDYSINLIAGYSLGVNRMEVGSLINVVRGNVRGFQLAGVSNMVGNNVYGFQYANFLNLTLGTVHGFQGSNFINYAGRNLKGFQVAGAGNVVVGYLEGYQLSAGYNYAHTVRSGHQIGAVNFADSSATVPFGFFSFVKRNGYRRYEVSTDEFNYFNTSFKTGMTRFYNIFTVGFNALAARKPLATIGYGFGTGQPLGKGWAANADLTANAVFIKNQRLDEIPAGLVRLSIGIERKLGKTVAFFAGPSVNIFISDHAGLIDKEGIAIKPTPLDTQPGAAETNYGWIGFVAAVRFCNR
ncbi:hypothetical protein DYBT9275_03454 [Dyadobacter sp. CECT 9275]|uniref:Secretin/TonB short N-terminal domain-containing protein n=1 Tax=Dyadobacter helix TaxID=2822344 RepID=A0A916JCP4_9BACT|nr:STN and carboxypeptidase regulatory-like domain-containing protein [Dyadobacter sp. CECT 9275]CAG5004817.1 hypothetical protein DYBT9275_03454 [Dyadobacter sp. CECT 9275]